MVKKFRIAKVPAHDWRAKKSDYVLVALGADGYSVPGDTTYHINQDMSLLKPKWVVTTTRGTHVGNYATASKAISAAKSHAKRSFKNPSLLSEADQISVR